MNYWILEARFFVRLGLAVAFRTSPPVLILDFFKVEIIVESAYCISKL